MAKRVVVIGAGPTGLATAYLLKAKADVEVIVLEKDDDVGGRAKTLALPDGFQADCSAQFFASNYKRTFRIMRELGIVDRLVEVDTKTFYGLYLNDEINVVPATIRGFLASSSFSFKEKIRLARLAASTAFRYRRGALVDPTRLEKCDSIRLSDHIERYYGAAILDKVVGPSVSMTMGTAADYSLAFAVSLAPIAIGKHYVFPDGMGTLTGALASTCDDIRLGQAGARLVVDGGNVLGVEMGDGREMIEADVVVCTVPAYDASGLLSDVAPDAGEFMDRVPYTQCLQVLFGTDRPHLPVWGLSIPESVGSFVGAVTEETFKSTRRAPSGCGLTQAWVSGRHADSMMSLSDEDVAEQVFAEIRRLVPSYADRYQFHHVIRRKKAINITYPGYRSNYAKLDDFVSDIKGLHLIGDYRTTPLIEGPMYWAERVVGLVG